jgi:hypothetical protein
MAMFAFVLAAMGCGASYVYFDPQLQTQLGVKSFIDNLPWKQERLLTEVPANPLRFERLSLALSTRAGEALSPPKETFTVAELVAAHYVRWSALFKNELAGLQELDENIEARFYAPSGFRIASSTDHWRVSQSEKSVSFSAVVLMPDPSIIKPGDYTVRLYSGDQMLTERQFTVVEDIGVNRTEETATTAPSPVSAAAAPSATAAEEGKRQEEARRLAMIQERMRKPLRLQEVEFVNSTKDGTVLSGPTNAFSVSKVLFIGWRVIFQNLLLGLDANQYRVDAAYIAPNGSTLGSVDDVQIVKKGQDRAVFGGRVGNSAGGAFLPGQYTVNFYLNGQYFTQKRFNIVADLEAPYGGGGLSGGGGGASATAVGLETPTLATGTIEKIAGRDNVPMELRLRPQPNGFLHGELVVHLPGYDPMKIDGFARGNRVEFTASHGAETFYFEGERGSWTTHAD